MRRFFFFTCLLVFSFAHPLISAPAKSRLFEVRLEKASLLYVEVMPGGEVFKAYPKPRAPLGKYSEAGGALVFTPAESLHQEDDYYPVVANILTPSALDDRQIAILRALFFESKGAKLELKEKDEVLTTAKWEGPATSLAWKDIEILPVLPAERSRIEAFEKILLGEWKFVRSTSNTGESRDTALQYKQVKFCADGSCVAEKENKFFWIDGQFMRLSFQDSDDWKKYSMVEEYDIIELNENELVIQMLATPSPPSRYKLRELNKTYPKNPLRWTYYFER